MKKIRNGLHSIFKSFLLLVFSTLILAGCGGGSSNSTTLQDDSDIDISSISTNPQNDLDSDGVTELVERLIEKDSTTDSQRYSQLYDVAYNLQKLLNSYGSQTELESLSSFRQSVSCLREYSNTSSEDWIYVKLITLNTPEKRKAYNFLVEKHFDDSSGIAGQESCV